MKSKRGFAGMDPEKQRELSSRGGKAAHAKGTAHEWSSEEAREAGRAGGAKVSEDREHMKEIGKKGGYAGGKIRAGKTPKACTASKVEVMKEGEASFDLMTSFPDSMKRSVP